MNPREEAVRVKAREFLLTRGIRSLPVNPFELIEHAGWGLVPYRRLAELCGLDGECLPALSKSKDGFTIFNGRNYCVAYNDAQSSHSRIVFTLMHEVGHIVLGHFAEHPQEELDRNPPALERDANLFASLVLAPAAVIRRCGFDTPEKLRAACGISLEAATLRLNSLARRHAEKEDKALLRQFDGYIRLNTLSRVDLRALDIPFDPDAYY